MGKSVARERRVDAYPSPVHYKLLVSENALTGESKSSIVAKALKLYYDTMSEPEKRKLLTGLK